MTDRDGKVTLPEDASKTLQDQDDVIIWTKFNILLQAVDELTVEHGHAGDATRQLRVVTQEAVRRRMFEASVEHRKPTDEQLWTWYMVLKQLIEGEAQGEWEPTEGSEEQYRLVIATLQSRGHTMPAQVVRLEPIVMIGELTKPQ